MENNTVTPNQSPSPATSPPKQAIQAIVGHGSDPTLPYTSRVLAGEHLDCPSDIV